MHSTTDCMVSKLVSLYDLYTLYCVMYAFYEMHHANENEYRPVYYGRKKCTPVTLVNRS